MTEFFAKRKINLEFRLAIDEQGDTQGPVVKVDGHRCSVSYTVFNGWSQGQVHVAVWGLPLSTINELTTIGPVMSARKNNGINIFAGDDPGKMSKVYSGIIYMAWADFQAAPENVLHIVAYSSALAQVKIAPTRSFPGEKNISEILQEIADEQQLTFEDNLLKPIFLRDQHCKGDVLSQIRDICYKANVNWTIEVGILAIWPKDRSRIRELIPVNKDTGLVGYPMFSSQGVILKMLYNPEIIQGGKIVLKSSLTPANGKWTVATCMHMLESEIPGGQWFTQVLCQRSLA